MSTPDRELPLEEVPGPPLYRLVDGDGAPAIEYAEIGDDEEESAVGAIFSTPDLAREFSENAAELGFPALAGLSPEEAQAGGGYPLPEAGYVLVVTDGGTGLFHAEDLAAWLSGESSGREIELDFPLYLLTDAQGETPLISVDDDEGELLVAALFTSPESARAFLENAESLEMPELLGTIDDADGLQRHARVAQSAGARYVVLDPEAGEADAIPVEDLIRDPDVS